MFEKMTRRVKDEMKNRISMALKDPILQQGFEIICKENAELEKENADLNDYNEELLQSDIDKYNKIVLLSQKVNVLQKKNAELEKENAELKSIAQFQTTSNMDRYFQLKRSKEQLTKAKELIKKLLNNVDLVSDPCVEEANNFLEKKRGSKRR